MKQCRSLVQQPSTYWFLKGLRTKDFFFFVCFILFYFVCLLYSLVWLVGWLVGIFCYNHCWCRCKRWTLKLFMFWSVRPSFWQEFLKYVLAAQFILSRFHYWFYPLSTMLLFMTWRGTCMHSLSNVSLMPWKSKFKGRIYTTDYPKNYMVLLAECVKHWWPGLVSNMK